MDESGGLLVLESILPVIREYLPSQGELIWFLLGIGGGLGSLLLQNLLPSYIMRKLRLRDSANEAMYNWLKQVETKAEQAEHYVNANGLYENGSVDPELMKKIQELDDLRTGPEDPNCNLPEPLIDRMQTVRNATHDATNTSYRDRAERNLQDHLEIVKHHASEEVDDLLAPRIQVRDRLRGLKGRISI